MTEKPRVPVEYYTDEYFDSWNYADRSMGRFSMYWFARRYYAALVRRYAPRDGGRLLEMGCGLGHLLGLLQDDYQCYGVDLIERSVRESRKNAPKAQVRQGDATDLSMYEDNSFSAVVALHLVEHLPEPDTTIREVARILKVGGIFLFATPHPEYALRRFKDRDTDAIGKDKTHINCHVPQVWRNWCQEAGLEMVKHFGDGLWDVPYLPLIPRALQFAMFGFPAFLQVITRTTWMPLALGVNQVGIARKRG